MTLKARYEKGKLVLLEEAMLQENRIYEVEVQGEPVKICGVRPSQLKELVGIVSLGGDALEDSEALYD